MPDYNAIAADNLNGLMREIAEYTRMAEEIAATLDGLKDTLKRYMDENGLDHIAGAEQKATYKPVTSCRIDTTALKKDLPEVAARYTRITRKEARKRYNAGEVARLCAVKLSPVNMWGCFADCCREALSPIAEDGFNTVVARSREFDTVVNAFTFYNCNAETGRYPAFYVKGV